MLSSELDYVLPPELIAQQPAEPRDSSRLMAWDRQTEAIRHRHFSDLPSLLRPNDLLVLNDSRVLRARLRGHKIGASGDPEGRIEMLLLREESRNCWEALLRPSARIRAGATLLLTSPEGDLSVRCTALDEPTGESRRVTFCPDDDRDIRELLPALGEVPLPHYIQSPCSDEQYQTVYARQTPPEAPALDSVAAPTAGLHFTESLLQQLRQTGIRTCHVTLAVGAGTFRPVRTEVLEEHSMHQEHYEVPAATAEAINEQKSRGARVVAVGTTTVRVLESAVQQNRKVKAGDGATRLFITPGHAFRCVDALLTNFHLPRSSLLALVAAFAAPAQSPPTGLAHLRRLYTEAISSSYRFYSFGDAMLIE